MKPSGTSQTPRLASSRVGILGLGLMGGSLALALRGRCAHLLGADPDPRVVRLAEEMKFLDQASTDPGEILPQTDLVVLAAPVGAIIHLIGELAALHPGRAVVLDIGSTKTQIAAAMEKLPERFDPIGGHPMCGKEKASLAHAEAGLFAGAVFALIPLERTSPRARSLAEQLVGAIGSLPVWLDALTHDRWVAATSHLPYLVANALALATPGEAAPLVGPGFRSTTRLAASFAPMMLDALSTNRENILQALGCFRNELERMESLLRWGDTLTLQEILLSSSVHHQELSQ